MGVKFIKPSFSIAALLLLCFSIIVTRLLLPFQNVLTWDVFGYYLYLPAKFIYHDLGLTDMRWLNNIMNIYSPSSTLYQINILSDGHGAMRYPCGLALLNSPFFFMAHASAYLFHFPPDGFSAPYRIFFAVGGLFYSIIGLYYFRKILLHFFDEKTSAFVLILIVAGTNYFEQATLQNNLTHNFLFTLYSILIYNTIEWHKSFKNNTAFLIGLSIGLVTITRANEMVCALIPLFWNIYDKSSLKNKILLIRRQSIGILYAISGLAIGLLPQLLYWKFYTGRWFYYSYEDPGVGFEFASPFIFQFLFSFRKGWFLYTPIMLIAVAGFYHLYKRNKNVFIPAFIYFIVNLYIVSSWSTWWYAGGSFSSRSLVSSYALMAIPLGYFLRQFHKKWFIVVLSLLVVLNLFQTWQSHVKIISNDRMTQAYYFRIFGKIKVNNEDQKLLLIRRSDMSVEKMPSNISFRITTLQSQSFENQPDKKRYPDTLSYNGKQSLIMDSSNIFTPPFEIPYSHLTKNEYAWLRINVWVLVPKNSSSEQLPLLVASFKNQKGETYKYRASEDKKAVNKGVWIPISLDYMTPEVRNENDRLSIYLWYRGKQPVFVDYLVISKYEP